MSFGLVKWCIIGGSIGIAVSVIIGHISKNREQENQEQEEGEVEGTEETVTEIEAILKDKGEQGYQIVSEDGELEEHESDLKIELV